LVKVSYKKIKELPFFISYKNDRKKYHFYEGKKSKNEIKEHEFFVTFKTLSIIYLFILFEKMYKNV
jgi:hypothetical protein